MGESGSPGASRCSARRALRGSFSIGGVQKGGKDGKQDIENPKPIFGRLGAKEAVAAVGFDAIGIRGASGVRGPGAVASQEARALDGLHRGWVREKGKG
jgi:hypothetical protein